MDINFDYFTVEELEDNLRLFFDYEECWDFDIRILLTGIVDRGADYYLEFRGRKFSINKITGSIVEL